MVPYEELYGWKRRSPVGWFEVGDHQLLGPDIIKDVVDKVKMIHDQMRTSQSRQKSYVDNRRQKLGFDVGDHVFLKVSPFKGIMRFGKSGKLSPMYVRPFEILWRYGVVAYELAFPSKLAAIHLVFHVSMLRKYLLDDSHVFSH